MRASPGMVTVGRSEEAPDRIQVGLPRRRSRDRVDDRDVGGNLITRQSIPQILHQPAGVGRGGFAQLHHGDGRFAEALEVLQAFAGMPTSAPAWPTVVSPVRSGISPVMNDARPAVQLASA